MPKLGLQEDRADTKVGMLKCGGCQRPTAKYFSEQEVFVSDPIRVSVIDAFPTLREGIVALLEPEHDLVVVTVTGDYGSITLLCLQQRPDVLLLGMDTPDAEMVDIVVQLKQTCPEIKILVFAAVGNEACIQTMINAGVSGYLLKTETHSNLVTAIRAVVRGEMPLSRSAVTSFLIYRRTNRRQRQQSGR